MKKILYIIIPLLLAACVMDSCSEVKEKQLISQQGIDDARTLIENAPDWNELQVETFLLEVRATAEVYRERYDDRAAEAYLKSFEDYIVLNSDSLATLILY